GGMLQFMLATARRYGLRVDAYVDERYDWKRSTHAAIAYLKDLYAYFDGSWPLAVSAYNMGEGGLQRAIAANGGERDLWRLIETPPASHRIKRETKKFYPKLLASILVAKNPEQYGFRHDPSPPTRTATMEVRGAYALNEIDRSVGLPVGTLAMLNPHVLRGYTPRQTPVYLAVPADMHTQVALAVESMPEMKASTHIVRRGETLSGIASLHGVSVQSLQSLNRIRSPRSLQIGQRLMIPGQFTSSG